MRAIRFSLVAVLLIALLPVLPLRADGVEHEKFVLALEGLLAELAGAKDARPVVTRLDNGHNLGGLTDFSATVNAVLSALNTDYDFWWVAVNTGADNLEKKTTNTLTGPSPKQKRSDDITYPVGAISGFSFNLDTPL